MLICHRCDNKRCVRPSHLYLGTCQTNAQDRFERKGSGNKGMKHGCAKLTDDQVREMRRLYAAGVRQTQLCKQFGMSHPVVSTIVRRKVWTHVT
jgi:hypothetical protein